MEQRRLVCEISDQNADYLFRQIYEMHLKAAKKMRVDEVKKP